MVSQHDSSSEEDGDEQWKAAINAVASATATSFLRRPTPPLKPNPDTTTPTPVSDEDDEIPKPQTLKHYQIKAQKILDEILEKSLVIVKEPNLVGDNPEVNESAVRLFRKSPIGIVFDYRDEPKGPRKKPKILPGEVVDEKSEKFKRRLESVVVEGMDVLASANDACQKSLAKWQKKQSATVEAAKREEERVAQLKKIRGEQWLPSIAREMQRQAKRRVC